MKKRLIIASFVLFISMLTISLTTAIFTPTIPTDCSNTQIMSTWDSIFKESSTGIAIFSNTSHSGKCDVYVAYKIVGENFNLLSGNDNSSALKITAIQGNATEAYKSKIRNITNVSYGYGFISTLTFFPEEDLTSRNINSNDSAALEFTNKFQFSLNNWALVLQSSRIIYISESTESSSQSIGAAMANFTVNWFIFSNTSTCTPNWTAHNTTCATNDKKTQYFTDSNSCNQAPSENLTFTCDFDSNGVMGNLTNFSSISSLTTYINSSSNLTRTMSGIQKVELKAGNYTAIEFDWNFSQALDLDKIYIERQSSSAPRGYILIRGIPASKKVLVQKLTDSTKICIRNAEISSIGEITNNCTGSSEILLDCPDSYSGISCSINNSFFIINGLTNSAVRETFSSTLVTNCTPNWNCTNFSVCANSLKSRNCNDLNHCNSSLLNKTDTQACISVSTCTPNWNCTNWTECSKSGNQTRICNDKNVCNSTTGNKKTETRTCDYEGSSTILWIIISIIAIIIVVIIILIILFLNKKPEESAPAQQPKAPVTQYGYSSQQGNQNNQGFNNSSL